MRTVKSNHAAQCVMKCIYNILYRSIPLIFLLNFINPEMVAQAQASVPMDVVHDFDIDTEAENEGVKEGEKGEFLSTGLMTSKLNRLVEELRKLQKSDSTAKCLVFSQFTQVSV